MAFERGLVVAALLGSAACTHAPQARLTACRPMLYPATVEATAPWVRAASGVATTEAGLVVVQDDATELAFVGGNTTHAVPIAMPDEAPEANRPRNDKLDLESIVGAGTDTDRVLAFGSGSAPARRVIVAYEPGRAATLHDAGTFFDLLGGDARFAGSELNVEGVVRVGAAFRFFQRGNGARRGDAAPVNATADVVADELVAYLEGGPPPAPTNVRVHDLGTIDGVPFGFTDASAFGGRVIFVAVAERSPDTRRDGEVLGARVGRLHDDGTLEMAAIVDDQGRPTRRKIEGIAPRRGATGLHAVVDADDPAVPADLCVLSMPTTW